MQVYNTLFFARYPLSSLSAANPRPHFDGYLFVSAAMGLLKPIPKRVSWFTCSQDGIGDSGMVSGIVNTLTRMVSRFEIHEALDRLYTQGFKATKVIIANRYLQFS
jgi:hypothetical protein